MYGGICGKTDTWHNDIVTISNSYNIGEIQAANGTATGIGIFGGYKENFIINNCYNAGMFKYSTSKDNVNSYSVCNVGTNTEIYHLDTIDAKYTTDSIEINADKLKSNSFAQELGKVWVQSDKGYPILKWQQENN